MLFVAAFAPTRPLRRIFPGRPFLSVFGRTPMVVWFSRVTEGCYRDAAQATHCLGGPEQTLYDEVTIMTVLRKRSLFCPLIYASNDLSIPIAKLYGMPKEEGPVVLDDSQSETRARIEHAEPKTVVRAQTGGRGGLLAAVLSRLWPVWSWPVRFPSGTSIQALIQSTPKVRLARVRQGVLALPVSWLPNPVSFFAVGLFIPQLRMQLPPPDSGRR
jgi:hypothetical protein